MTRTLPWQTQQIQKTQKTQKPKPRPNAKETTPNATAPRPAKRQRLLDLYSDDEAPGVSAASTTKAKEASRPRQPDRSPSTSPIPEPLPEEFMREGFRGDDIYMMVEDEFYSMARSFTQHLHHAEYKRLKQVARARKASASTKISRPTDTTTVMRAETRKRKEQEERSARLKEAVNKIGTKTAHDDNEVKPSGPGNGLWTGTHLQNLMTSPSKAQKSLMGLQGLASSSRASAGYAQPERKTNKAREFDLPPRDVPRTNLGGSSDIKKLGYHTGTVTLKEGEYNGDDDDDDNDLDTHVGRHTQWSPISNTASKNVESGKSVPKRPSEVGKTAEIRPGELHATEKATITKDILAEGHTAAAHDTLDSFSMPTLLRSRRTAPSRRRKIPETKPGGDIPNDNNNVDEVPIFLI